MKRFWMIIWPSIVMRAMQWYAMAPEQPVFTLGESFARSQHVGVDNEWILRVTSSKEIHFSMKNCCMMLKWIQGCWCILQRQV